MPDAAGGAENGDLPLRHGLGRVAPASDSLYGSDEGHGRPHLCFALGVSKSLLSALLLCCLDNNCKVLCMYLFDIYGLARAGNCWILF